MAFGIDFGTTNSVLAVTSGGDVDTVSLDSPPQEWAELGFDKVLPTVIADSGGALAFGWRAKRSSSKLEAVKRLFASEDEVRIGNRTLQVEEAAGVFFRAIKERATEAGLTLDQAVVTIPANSRGVARFRTKVSAGLSGIEVLALINEPTAAAMAYGRRIGDGERVLVFDWGGGTLDVTILRSVGGVFMEEASKGIQRLGGIDIDSAFAAAMRAKVPAGSSLDPFDLERAKVLLSTRESVVVPLAGGGTLEVTRGELEDAIRPLIVRTAAPINTCLADIGGASIHHLVLVGGSSKIPVVQRYVREMLRLDPMTGVDPMTAVAEGAALAAGILNGEIDDFDFFVGTEHALGTVVHREGKPHFSTLIPRNTKLPASATDSFSPVFDEQESVLIKVIEGDPDKAFDHEDNVVLKEWDVALPDKRPVADAGFSIAFEYDVDGILNVRAADLKTSTVFLDQQLAFGAAVDKKSLVEIRRRIDSTATVGHEEGPGEGSVPAPRTGGLSLESRASVRKAKEKIYPFVDDDVQQELDELIDRLLAAPAAEEAAARDALDRTIRQHAYLL
ncbi:Hsp70 family protein [Blastococcus sp. SYSU DS0617]